MTTDRVIYSQYNGKMEQVQEPTGLKTNANFLIICDMGDWSGFRTLKECEAQFEELEAKQRRDGFFRVVER